MLANNGYGQPLHESKNSQGNGHREPLAIIGMGCHFPGNANSPEAFWNLLCSGTDATREVPTDRWDVRKFYDPEPQKSGKMIAARGGYLEHLDQFDAQFFGIAPREAIWLDPQQRMLLQVTWEALEDAGLPADQLIGSNTSVFIGGFTLDYQILQNYGVLSRYELQTNSATGMMMTMLANRISYVFGLQGPSLAVDTACSGSLVAVHLACQSIWNGESTLAIAGGANAMIVPTMTIAESKGGFLSPDGRCKAFDASANGYARGEGAGVVIIKPLSQAQTDGDPIYAVIRGTAVTQDGHTNGITVPNQTAQEAAMRLAYQRAGIEPKDIQYVEAHGTGTPVGDPIEARAIGTVLSSNRPKGSFCTVSSVKANIGHLEAAAGVAGLIKTALALKHGQIPPHPLFRNPNPNIPFDSLQIHVPTTLEAWPETDGPALAGVNSFGFGGTNAHVVLQGAPAQVMPEREVVQEGPYLLTLSARSAEALRATAETYRDFLSAEDVSSELYDIAYTASLRRSHHDHRMAVVAHSKEEAAASVDTYLAGNAPTSVATGRVSSNERPKTVFVCSGMGPQWWAMGRDLLEHEPVFRASIEHTSAALEPYTGWSLLEVMCASKEQSQMDETEFAQPANFALQVALTELWRSRGIIPDAIIGHSAGEVASHYLAGSLSFEDAIKVIYHRSRLQQKTTGQGRMLAVGMTMETLNQAVHDAGEGVSIAAINSPSAITLVGESSILENMAKQLSTFQVFHRFLNGKVPYHSHYMEPLREELLSSLADLKPRSTHLPLYSTVTGTRVSGRGANARYWWQNIRSTVLFSAALTQMIQDGYGTFIELSPHPVLASSIKELLTQQEQEGNVLPSLNRKEEDRMTMLSSLGALHTLGYPISWEMLYEQPTNLVKLPVYSWQMKSYWTESEEAREDRLYKPVHPLLGQRLSAAHPTWELELTSRLQPYLADHRIQGHVLLPGAAYIEMAQAAAKETFGNGTYVLEEFTFSKALFLLDTSDARLQTVIDPQNATINIYSYTPTGDSHWALHASCKLSQRQPSKRVPRLDLGLLRQRCNQTIEGKDFYQQFYGLGFQYGPAFQTIEHIQLGERDILCQITVPASVLAELEHYAFHPAMLDAAFQTILAAVNPEESTPSPYLPVGVERIRIFGAPTPHMQAYGRLRQVDERLVIGDVQLVDQDGHVLAQVEGFRAQSLDSSMSLTPERIDKGLYELEWLLAETVANETTSELKAVQDGPWLIFTDQTGIGQGLVQHLEKQGEHFITIAHAESAELVQDGDQYTLNTGKREHFQCLLEALSTRGITSFSRAIYLWGLDAKFSAIPTIATLEQDQSLVCLSVMYLMQALSQSGWTQLPHLWLVTRGAQDVGESQKAFAVEQAPLWGLGRVIGHQEFTSIWGGLIDLDPGATIDEQASALFTEIAQATDEDQIALRNAQRYVARLLPNQHLTAPFPPSLRADGSYLITGGLGKLGLLVARWMVMNGARRLILMGRTRMPVRSDWHKVKEDHPQKVLIQSIQELEALGATIHLAAVDVANEAQVSTFLAEYAHEGWPPIRGVIHTAGIVKDELLLRMSTETFESVLWPKVKGGWLLHELLKDAPLDFFLLFSSTGSVIASIGQGNYAAANAFLDALAYYRQSHGLPAMSIGWGPWSIGMVEQLHLEQFYIKRGIELIVPEVGLQVMGRVMGQSPAQLTAITVNWTTARETSPQGKLPPLFGLLGNQGTNAEEGGASSEEGLLDQLRVVEESERLPVLASHLKAIVALVLQLDPSQFGEQEPIVSLGMDSMMAIEIKHRIGASMKVDVSVLELLQGGTIAQLSTRILSSLQIDEVVSAEVSPILEELQQLVQLVDSEELDKLLAELERTPEGEATV